MAHKRAGSWPTSTTCSSAPCALLVDDPGELLGRLRGEIELLLVDEFQDTDPVQGAIVEAIAGGDPESARLFLVGDSKQSIYRFRSAEPRIFDRFREGFHEDGRLSLTGNFRSVPGVIDFVNVLFQDLYQDDSDALRAERSAPSAADDPPAVEFVWAHDSDAPTATRVWPPAAASRPAGSPG